MDGSSAWTEQNPLGSSFRLRFMDRFGYGRSADRPDDARLEADIAAVMDLAHGGAHLVGHSYGALICLVATARAPAEGYEQLADPRAPVAVYLSNPMLIPTRAASRPRIP